MSTPPRPDPTSSPHLSLAARKLLAHSRAKQAAALPPAPRQRRRWGRWVLMLLIVVAAVSGGALYLNRTGQWVVPTMAQVQALLPTPAPTATPFPSDAEFAAILEAAQPTPNPTASSVASVVVPPPQAEPPEEDVPALPRSTPTIPPDTKIRPLPWPLEPAAGRPDRIYALHVGLDTTIEPVGFTLRTIDDYRMRIYDVARYAAGWHTNSSLPGWQGNTILSGHHNAWGRVFRPALDLEPGDFVFVEVDDVTYSYLVVIKEILPELTAEQRRENGRWIAQTEDERLTLVTCYPPDGNTHRVVIVAIPAK